MKLKYPQAFTKTKNVSFFTIPNISEQRYCSEPVRSPGGGDLCPTAGHVLGRGMYQVQPQHTSKYR